MTERLPAPVAVTGGPRPDFDALWRAADLPDVDRDAWREVLGYRTRVPDDAVRLASHGWTPEDVVKARTEPRTYWPELGEPRPTHSAEAVASLAVLADETARFHDASASLARSVRADYVRVLAERESWPNPRIADLLEITRQRVRMILRVQDGQVDQVHRVEHRLRRVR